jgi:hypothetical protein
MHDVEFWAWVLGLMGIPWDWFWIVTGMWGRWRDEVRCTIAMGYTRLIMAEIKRMKNSDHILSGAFAIWWGDVT